MNEGLTNICIKVTWQASEPRFDGIKTFADRGEAETIDDPLDGADLLLDGGGVRIHHGHCDVR